MLGYSHHAGKEYSHENTTTDFEKAAIDRYPEQRGGGHFLFDRKAAVALINPVFRCYRKTILLKWSDVNGEQRGSIEAA